MKNERTGPVKVYINVTFGDVLNSAVVQDGTDNNASIDLPQTIPYDLIKALLALMRGPIPGGATASTPGRRTRAGASTTS